MISAAVPATLDGDALWPRSWGIEAITDMDGTPHVNCLIRLPSGHVFCVELAALEVVNGVWLMTARSPWRSRLQREHEKHAGGLKVTTLPMQPRISWWTRVKTRVAARPAHRDMTQVVELTAAGVLAAWGVVLCWPADTFNGASYAPMRAVGLGENVWGLIFLAVALLISGGIVAARRKAVMMGMVLASGLFTFVAVVLAMGNAVGFGWAGNLGYVVLCVHVVRRMRW